ncbi:hypothetical protein ARMGADRAFT_1144795 [Armillaria gallica]|uniref:Uncharacterized protein n=1 Tax=Armillaria gallica TaxID=47427 RepID=A0A2H3DML8_ARMGA|nr:hypothetical protein ARMGADRAFT_1144795 [Armillaria gallica]
MYHHREEIGTELLTPSRSNGDLSPPTEENPETNLSSSSAMLSESPLSPAQRIRLRGTPAVIAGLLLGAALTAVLHHIYLSNLRGRTVSVQFWIKNSSNALSTLVQWLCMGSVSVSLTQLIWWLLRHRPFTILQLNHLFGLPDPLRILGRASARKLRNAIPVITIGTLLQTFALVSILAPNSLDSLEVGSVSPKNTTISVPTAFFNKSISRFDCDMTPSADSEKILRLALQSETLLDWNAPAGCGTACNYTIQYSAPALRCTELAIDEANAMLLPYPSHGVHLRTYDTNGKSTVAGTRCSLYNTTQQSVITFVNNTGMIFPSIISYNSPVNTTQVYIDTCLMDGGSRNATSSALFTYTVVERWLFGQLDGDLLQITDYIDGEKCTHFDPGANSSFNLASNNLLSPNETAGTFTPNNRNVSSALEQILVNLTVALITHWGQTTMVVASVAQDQLVWVYHIQKLWIVYATVLTVTAACGAVGLACMLKNGEDRDLTFWDIVRATRNSELDAVIDGEKRGDAGESTMLQYTVQGRDLEANTSGVFILARPCRKGSN